MLTLLRTLGLTLALSSLAGFVQAAPAHDNGHYDWQRHNQQARRDRDWQRQQEAELERRARWQHQRDMEWQRQQQAELRRMERQQRYNNTRYDRRYDRDYDRHYSSHWQRGHRYNGPMYVVRDYGHYHLRRPPHGHQWVRDRDNKYLLVAIATGLILDIATR